MKRLLDCIVATMFLILLSPLLLLLAIVGHFSLGSPVLFRQQRPGLHGRPFTIIKFRTMKNDVDTEEQPLPDDQRITRLGQFLRATSLDELPELWNILRGDMSLVGPRPLLMEYLPLYSTEQARRHKVRPGITGWAQINGRNTLSWERKFELDTWYVDNQSFWIDLKIVLLTVKKVLLREGISAEGEITTQKYTGSWPR